MVRDGGLPFVYKKRPLRIGVLPRYALSADEIRWFETGDCVGEVSQLPGGCR
jgi:carotenoid cleavage dioxygenase